MVFSPEELRRQVGQLLEEAMRTDDSQKRIELAQTAFELAQQAEAIERLNQKLQRTPISRG